VTLLKIDDFFARKLFVFSAAIFEKSKKSQPLSEDAPAGEPALSAVEGRALLLGDAGCRCASESKDLLFALTETRS